MNHETTAVMADLDAERSVIGAMLMNDDIIPEITDYVTAADFTHFAHAIVFAAIIDKWSNGQPVDSVTIAAALAGTGELAKIGGGPYLHDLLESVPTVANGPYYARIVADHGRRRRIDEAGARIRQIAHKVSEDIDTVAEECDRALADAIDGTDTTETFADYFTEAFTSLEHDGKNTGTPTGFPDLDRLTGGLEAGCLYIAAARPGMGKTVLLTDITRHVAIREGLPVLFASLEMSGKELAQRLATAESGTPAAWWKGVGTPTDDGMAKIANAGAVIAESPLEIDTHTGMTITRLRSRARKFAARHGGKLGLIVVDYLQLMQTTGKPESRQVEIAAYSRGLKLLAKDLGCPILVAAQLNRENTNRTDKRPQLSDLRESGAIEQDADVVMLIHRDDYYDKDSPRAGEADIIVAKNRSGSCGDVVLAAQLHKSRFVSMARA